MCKKLGFFAIFFSSALAFTKLYAALPANYQALSAEQKQGLLWENIEASRWNTLPKFNDSGWGGVLKSLRALATLSASFDHSADELPAGRTKIIHTYGVAGKVTFVPAQEANPFTGIYKNQTRGIARLSLAASPELTPYTPGMALKFLIDGQPSRNLHVMHSVNGQGDDWNFFSHSFSNRIDPATGFILRVVEVIFQTVRSPANDLPVSHLATIDVSGTTISESCAPSRLFFRPAKRLERVIASESRTDMRVSLGAIEPGPLYEVYGIYEGREYHVGTLNLDSQLLASAYADKHLFFQHKR